MRLHRLSNDQPRGARALTFLAAFVLACSPGPTFPGTPYPPPTEAPHWQAQVSSAVAGEPVRLILSYQPYLSAPVSNEISFTARCDNCEPTGAPGSARAPLTIHGRLVLTPEFCQSSSATPKPDSQICWSAPIVFPAVGTWHLTTPFDVDVQISGQPGVSVSNGTTLAVTILVNGTRIQTFAAGSAGTIPTRQLPAFPWSIEAHSPSGRLLSALIVRPGDVLQTAAPGGGRIVKGDGVRVDLSCGRLDVWVGPPLAGPVPGSGSPGDCAP